MDIMFIMAGIWRQCHTALQRSEFHALLLFPQVGRQQEFDLLVAGVLPVLYPNKFGMASHVPMFSWLTLAAIFARGISCMQGQNHQKHGLRCNVD